MEWDKLGKLGKQAFTIITQPIVDGVNSYLENERIETPATLVSMGRKQVCRGRSLMEEGTYDVLLPILGERGIQKWANMDLDSATDLMKGIMREHPEVLNHLKNNF